MRTLISPISKRHDAGAEAETTIPRHPRGRGRVISRGTAR